MRIEGQGNAVEVAAKIQSSRAVVDKNDAATNRIRMGAENQLVVQDDVKEAEQGKDVMEAAKILNEAMTMASCHLEFQPYEESGKFQVQVVDNRTKTVIKEIPPDYMLELAGRFREMLDSVVGLFVNEIV
ncbi:MAG: flagellar protein FlaG [Syntrophomonadaceae bacterium]|nr:flagellar protein FlaG [Syntrophomonadaceae bacterium]